MKVECSSAAKGNEADQEGARQLNRLEAEKKSLAGEDSRPRVTISVGERLQRGTVSSPQGWI